MPDQYFSWAGIEKSYQVFIITSMIKTIEVMKNTGRLFLPPLCVANRMFDRPYGTSQIAVRLLGSQSTNQNAAFQPTNQSERGTL